jgi:hypothetical protein
MLISKLILIAIKFIIVRVMPFYKETSCEIIGLHVYVSVFGMQVSHIKTQEIFDFLCNLILCLITFDQNEIGGHIV